MEFVFNVLKLKLNLYVLNISKTKISTDFDEIIN